MDGQPEGSWDGSLDGCLDGQPEGSWDGSLVGDRLESMEEYKIFTRGIVSCGTTVKLKFVMLLTLYIAKSKTSVTFVIFFIERVMSV